MENLRFEKSSISAKLPTSHESSSKSVKSWLKAKRVDDDAEGLWRVHDKLYDLVNFVQRHPGGRDWLELTQGTDITELFETHHIRGKAELLLQNFYVREAKLPRNFKLTFFDDGFYKTLRRKVADQLIVLQTKPMKTSNTISDLLLITTFLSAVVAAKSNNNLISILAGVSLAFLGVTSHNYLHRRDSWRMFCINLTGFNYREWRVSHVISHHMYPNTFHDLEVTTFEPIMRWIPGEKSDAFKRISTFIPPLVWCLIIKTTIVKRTFGYFSLKENEFKLDHLLTFVLPSTMYFVGRSDALVVLKLWLITITVTSFLVGLIGTTSGHHHPMVYHEGDELPKSMDFGIFQINAMVDRSDIKKSHFLGLTQFGHHTLHHLFPTIDHGFLPYLNELFLDTCQDFEVDLREFPWWPLIVGQFQQLKRTKNISLREMNPNLK